MEAKYIFGIIETSEEKLFNSYGFTAHEEVYTIPYQDISAVVSDSSLINYTTVPKDQVARFLLRHQQVIEKVMDSYTIIPMRLGTYALNIREVEEILSKGYAMFKDIFRKINDKIEIDVVATWNDLNSVIKEIGEQKEVKELKEKLRSKPEGVSVEDQIKMGNLIKDILDKKREKIFFEIGELSAKVTIDLRAHDLMDDRMIFNTAFLISKDNQGDFDEKVEELNRRYLEKINFRCVGPLPAYSFYTVEVKQIRFDEIDLARKRLCLNDTATMAEIEKAYRNRAFVYHPDRNLSSQDAEGKFNELTKAYRLLREYLQSVEQESKDGRCSFREEDFGHNSIIVKVRD